MICIQNVNGGFSGNEYEKLKKVYCTWIITDERDKQRRGIVTRVEAELKGRMEEKVNSAVEYVKNAMESFNVNTDEAMKALRISDDIKAKVLEKLTEEK